MPAHAQKAEDKYEKPLDTNQDIFGEEDLAPKQSDFTTYESHEKVGQCTVEEIVDEVEQPEEEEED